MENNEIKTPISMPLAYKAEEAIKKAVAAIIEDRRLSGDPIVIWRDGKVVKIPVDQIEVREHMAEYKTDDDKDE